MNDYNDANLFERIKNASNDLELNDIIDGEEFEPIDLDAIGQDASKSATNIIDNISELYANKEFMEKNPKIKRRIDTELETLRILIKMRKADEVTHDILIGAISEKKNNASLYRAMTEVQKAILSVTTKIEEVMTGLENILKNYQLELNFDDNEEKQEESDEETNNSFRGSKEFITSIINN